MALRAPHGTAAKYSPGRRVEVRPIDELPAPIPAPADDASRAASGESGRFVAGNRRSVLGGRAKGGKTALAASLGIPKIAADDAFAPYLRWAESFRRFRVAEIAKRIGGGECSAAPSSFVASAALQLAASRFLFATANGDREVMAAASALANASRLNLIAANDLAAEEAKSRPKEDQIDSLARRLRVATTPPAVEVEQSEDESVAAEVRQ